MGLLNAASWLKSTIDGWLASTGACSYLDTDATALLCTAFDECREPEMDYDDDGSYSYCFNDCDSCKNALQTGLTGCLDDCEDWENEIVSTYCCHYASYSYGFDPYSSYICEGEADAGCANYFVPTGVAGMNRDAARESRSPSISTCRRQRATACWWMGRQRLSG